MQGQGAACFGYHLEKNEGGWRWTAFARDGRVSAEGSADSRALAAACVIRALAEQALGDAERDKAA